MNEQPSLPEIQHQAGDGTMTHRLLLFFALVYVVEGLGQIGGLIAQPLNYYLKTAQGWTPVQITAFISLFNLPWIIKPLYGLISDFSLRPLVLISAAFTAVAFVLVPLLRLGDKKQGEPWQA